MKTLFLVSAVMLLMMFHGQRLLAYDFGTIGPAVVVQAPENIFIPSGFDDNDNTQVVLYGYLTDTCHKVGPVDVKVDKEQKKILIKNQVYYYPGCWCAQVVTPYTQTVNLGILRAGGYTVAVEHSDNSLTTEGQLPVAVATTSNPDDYLYAPVEQMHFTRTHRGSPATLTLTGTFASTCMSMQEVKVTPRSNHVVEVQPIAAMAEQGCRAESRAFSTTVDLKGVEPGRTLIHVRSLNGASLNQVVDFF